MNGPSINRQILKAVSEKTADDPVLQQFIKEMLFEELEHPTQWSVSYTHLTLPTSDLV